MKKVILTNQFLRKKSFNHITINKVKIYNDESDLRAIMNKANFDDNSSFDININKFNRINTSKYKSNQSDLRAIMNNANYDDDSSFF